MTKFLNKWSRKIHPFWKRRKGSSVCFWEQSTFNSVRLQPRLHLGYILYNSLQQSCAANIPNLPDQTG